MLVDDEDGVRAVAARMLMRAGYEVLEARDGAEAAVAALNRQPAVVVTDLEMPVMNGLEATSLIREREGRIGRHTPVVAVTSTTDQERCFAVGMDAYIAKPLSPDVLSATMEQVLGI